MKKVEFIAINRETLKLIDDDCPYPAAKKLPEWFQKTPKFLKGKPKVDQNCDPNTTVKNCMPFVDLLTAGYFIPLPTDLWVTNEGPRNKTITWRQNQLLICGRHDNEGNENLPQKEGFENFVDFKLLNPWIVRTPKGYSCLFQPPYMHEAPFEVISAIVDTDKHPLPVNLPFRFKKDFSGLIPKGTPMVQIIPFKREKWTSSMSFDDGSIQLKWDKALTTFFDRYRKYFRSEKAYKCPFHK